MDDVKQNPMDDPEFVAELEAIGREGERDERQQQFFRTIQAMAKTQVNPSLDDTDPLDDPEVVPVVEAFNRGEQLSPESWDKFRAALCLRVAKGKMMVLCG
jgi:hypothetical protein